MFIQRLYVQNFRSFRQIDLALPDFSVLVGANAAGKSNFIQVFRFLRDVAREGFENAIALQGGVEYLRNFKLGASVPLEIRVSVSLGRKLPTLAPKAVNSKLVAEFEYGFKIEFPKRGRRRYRVAFERLAGREELLTGQATTDYLRQFDIVRKSGNKLHVRGLSPLWTLGRARKLKRGIEPPDETLPGVETSILQAFHTRLPYATEALRSVSTFDFDLKSLKKPAPLESRPYLAEDGSNLAAIVRRLTADESYRRRLQLHLRRFLPFIADIKAQATTEKAVAYQVQETYAPRLLPSQLLSDGTAEVLAIIVALYFTPSSVTIIEEPDRNLHPALIERLVNACQEVSTQKPVIITTHNPEVVRFAPLESLLLVERDAEGFSVIKKPSDSAMVQEFLKHELMPSELFVDNLLGV